MNIPNLLEIAVAWHRARKPTEQQQQVAEARLQVCDGCEYKNFRMLTRSYICDACGCPLSKKVYSPRGPEACPKNKWHI